MKKWKKFLLAVLVIAVASATYGYYLIHKKPADVRRLSAKYELTSTILVNEFIESEAAANKKYLDKVVSVKGNVADIKVGPAGQVTIFLESDNPLSSVTCSFYDDEAKSVRTIQKGDEIIVKGICTGILMDVVLNKCSIIK